jgi:hypothetical protein
VKEMFVWVLIGTLIIFVITTVLADTALGARFDEDEQVLFVLRVIPLLASIVPVAGMLVTLVAIGIGSKLPAPTRKQLGLSWGNCGLTDGRIWGR